MQLFDITPVGALINAIDAASEKDHALAQHDSKNVREVPSPLAQISRLCSRILSSVADTHRTTSTGVLQRLD